MVLTESTKDPALLHSPKRWREKDGRLTHDGDCQFWGRDICTCGLLHHLMPNPPSEDNDWFWEERARHENQMDRIPKPLPYVKPTKKELAERQKLLDEVFPNNEIDFLTGIDLTGKTPAQIAMARRKEYKDTVRKMH